VGSRRKQSLNERGGNERKRKLQVPNAKVSSKSGKTAPGSENILIGDTKHAGKNKRTGTVNSKKITAKQKIKTNQSNKRKKYKTK